MKTIYKYPLETTDNQTVEMPLDSKILCIQVQGDKPCLWAMVNTEAERKEKRFIEIFGTGNEMHYDMGVSRNYIGTYQLNNGSFVGHVFEYTGV